MRKNMTTAYGTNLKMNDETYKLRREVIEIIYQAKNLCRSNGIDLPRIDVRIADMSQSRALGVGRLRNNIIWISTKALTTYKAHLRDVVYHEIIHAVTGFGHDNKCPLMAPCIEIKPLTDDVANKLFIHYMKNHY